MLTLTCILKTADDQVASDALCDHLLMHLPTEWPDEREESLEVTFKDTPEPRVVVTTCWLGDQGESTLTAIMNRWLVQDPTCIHPHVELLHFAVATKRCERIIH